MRTVLIVSPHFPPSTLAGVHRARHLAKHLPAHGWRPIVVRAHERHYSEPGDPALAALVPEKLEQARTGALPTALCRLVGVGDIGLRALPYLRHAIARLIATERPAAVLITGSPFYPMLLARRIARQFHIPVVLDFQDPWVSAHGAARRPGSKGWAAHRIAVALEPQAVRHAGFITAVSDLQNDEMAARYPWLDRRRMAAIPIGGDPEDFAALRAAPVASEVRLDPAFVNFSYVGTFLPRAGPLVEQLFAALAQLRRETPDLAARLRLHFVGTSNQPDGAGGARVLPYARAAGVADLVSEVPRRLPYLEALSLIAGSNSLLLIGSDEPHYTASKIYPALLSGRPYLSLFHALSSAHAILSSAKGGRAIAFSDAAELQATIPALAEALQRLAADPGSFGKVRLEAVAPYTAHEIAGRFAAVLDQVTWS
jgi:hypothetical protein